MAEKEKVMVVTITELPHIDDGDSFTMTESEKPMAMIGSEAMLPIKMLDTNSPSYKKDYAYLYDGYFYLYRGGIAYNENITEPGIYYDSRYRKFILAKCIKDDPEYDIYKATPDHIAKINPKNIADDLREHETEIYRNSQINSKVYIPVISDKDDILKRAMKQALQDKGIDLDQYRSRFTDKNALFNFKQVLKGDNKLSMMLFERGCEALNLRYVIQIEELHSEDPVGKGLSSPIVVSSEDTFDA